HLLSDPEDVTLDDNPWAEYIDAANAGSLHIRSRRPGDTIQPLGLQGHSAKVSDIMVNRRIPRELRDQWPIVSNESHIVWVVGLALDRRVKIHEETRGVIQLRCQQRAM